MKEDYEVLHGVYDYDDIPERDSYILLCKYKEGDKLFQFICNRNSWDFNQLYNDKYIRWFEYENIPSVMNIDKNNVEILETLYGVDNYERRHQKSILNPKKKEWLEAIVDSQDDNEIITNKVIKNYKHSIRQLIFKRYWAIRNHIMCMSSDRIYEIIKQIWFNDVLMKELDKQKYKFMSNKTEMNEIGVVAIVFRDYLLRKKRNKEKYPFPKGCNIKKIIEAERINGVWLR